MLHRWKIKSRNFIDPLLSMPMMCRAHPRRRISQPRILLRGISSMRITQPRQERLAPTQKKTQVSGSLTSLRNIIIIKNLGLNLQMGVICWPIPPRDYYVELHHRLPLKLREDVILTKMRLNPEICRSCSLQFFRLNHLYPVFMHLGLSPK